MGSDSESHIPSTNDRGDENKKQCTYKEGILSYWVINDHFHDGEYHDPSVARDGQLHVVDLGIV